MGDNKEKKIFDDFPTVDCNECEHWYDNRCDGVPVGSEKPCTAFKAVRRVNIPSEIERLRKALTCLIDCVIAGSIVLVMWFIALTWTVLYG